MREFHEDVRRIRILTTINVVLVSLLLLIVALLAFEVVLYAKNASEDINGMFKAFDHVSQRAENIMMPIEKDLPSLMQAVGEMPQMLKNIGRLANTVSTTGGLAKILSTATDDTDASDDDGGGGLFGILKGSLLSTTEGLFGAASEIDGDTVRQVKGIIGKVDRLLNETNDAHLVDKMEETVGFIHDAIEPIMRAIALLQTLPPTRGLQSTSSPKPPTPEGVPPSKVKTP